jgi:voltage-gated potassium channel
MIRRLYEIIEKSNEDDRIGHLYDLFMIVMIFVSIIPLAVKNPGEWMQHLDDVCLIIFIIDYILHLICAPYAMENDDPVHSYLKYPFTPMAIVDLVAILPYFTPLNSTLRVVRIIRVIRLSRVFRLFRLAKLVRYSKNTELLSKMWKKSRDSLIIVCIIAAIYILVSALVIFNAEPDSFDTFFEAVYFSVISLATIGFGDVVPVTHLGRLITMLSSFFGLGIIALPSSIITASYMSAIHERDEAERIREMREEIKKNMERENRKLRDFSEMIIKNEERERINREDTAEDEQ